MSLESDDDGCERLEDVRPNHHLDLGDHVRLVHDNSTNTPMLLITSNVGSIFEFPDKLIPQWKSEILQHIQAMNPSFVAIHFQEVGGKNIQSGVVDLVKTFSQDLVERAGKLGFTRHCLFFDQNFNNSEKFTALGSLYLIHKDLSDVQIYNFTTKKFQDLEESQFIIGDLDEPMVTLTEKHKFPLQFFPEKRYSRKGYLRTRFRLQGTSLDLVNIHLFHDANNLVSCESKTSVYCEFRRKALDYTLDRLQNDSNGHPMVPFFILGDFNFRLQGQEVLRRLNQGLQRKESEVGDLVQYKDHEDQVLLSIGKKEFQLENHEVAFMDNWSQWKELDQEISFFENRLCEIELNFPPTYPFEENPNLGRKYLRTRIPSWCDRILFSPQTRSIMSADPVDDLVYDTIGKETAMGDHKPLFLKLCLVSGANEINSNHCLKLESSAAITSSHCSDRSRPSLESPTYTDLLSNTGVMSRSRYIDINDVARVKVFKETTV